MEYPDSKRIVHQESYGENEVSDPYAWMHQLDSKDVSQWLENQHRCTESYFKGDLEYVKRELYYRLKEDEMSIFSLSYRHGKYMGVYDAPNEKMVVFTSEDQLKTLTPVRRAEAPYTSIFSAEYSPTDPNLYLFTGYYDQETRVSINIVDATTQQVIDRFGFGFDSHWSEDGKYIYYSKAIPNAHDPSHSVQEIYRYDVYLRSHDLLYLYDGDAVVVYFEQSGDNIVAIVDINYHDKKILVIHADGTVQEVSPVVEIDYSYIGTIGEYLYFVGDDAGSSYGVMRLTLDTPWEQRTQFDKIQYPSMDAKVVGNHIVIFSKEDAEDQGRIYDATMTFVQNIKLPSSFASLRVIGESHHQLYLSFDSLEYPPCILRFNGDTFTCDRIKALTKDDAATHLIIEKHKVTLRDGETSVLYLAKDSRVTISKDTPLLMYGYGGFGASATLNYTAPTSEYKVKDWCEKGGVFVHVILRGGGEYGGAWHRAGKLMDKQNSFNDLYDMTEYLHAYGVSAPKKTIVSGASNGGLLVSAAFTQRPDLYGVILDSVGLHDMLYFIKDPRGSMYQTEYGNPYDTTMFDYLKSYSPYHNVKTNDDYPAIYIHAGFKDTNVPAYHAMKFAAEVQFKNPQGNPALLRILPNGHHDMGHGKEYSVTVAERQRFVERTLALAPILEL